MPKIVVETAKLLPAVAFHQAHKIVGRLVLESIRSGKKPAEWTGADLQRFDPAMQPDMVKFMNPTEGLKTRSVSGGHGPFAGERGDC